MCVVFHARTTVAEFIFERLCVQVDFAAPQIPSFHPAPDDESFTAKFVLHMSQTLRPYLKRLTPIPRGRVNTVIDQVCKWRADRE